MVTAIGVVNHGTDDMVRSMHWYREYVVYTVSVKIDERNAEQNSTSASEFHTETLSCLVISS